MRPRNAPLTRFQELRLSRPERRAARAERAVERQMRLERDNVESSARRAAALEAEARRTRQLLWPPD